MNKKIIIAGAFSILGWILTGCDSGPSNLPGSLNPSSTLSSPTAVSSNTDSPTGAGPTGNGKPPVQSKPASQRVYSTDFLLFSGAGTWATEVNNLENILNQNGASYQVVSSSQLDSMSVADIAKFGVLIFPGGAGGTEASSLSAATHARLREAVQVDGVSYIGFCAGSFIGEAPAPKGGADVSYGLGIVDGPVLDYYYLENQGTDIAMTLLSFPGGSTKDILWYGGPVTPSGASQVIAKYPDGTAAISEIWSGQGFVILSGVHPTANSATLAALGVSSSDGTHQDFAWTLLSAALHQAPLAAF